MTVKKLHRVLAMIPAIALLACSMRLHVQAADGTTVTDNPDGTTTEQRITTTQTTDPETGNVTLIVTVAKETKGTTADGVETDLEETATTTTVTDANGNLLYRLEAGHGNGTRDWSGESTGNGPEVAVELLPGGTASNRIDGYEERFVEGDPPENQDDREYNYTETTVTTDRAVSTVTHELEIDPSSSDYDGFGETPVSIAPEEYEGKGYNDPDTNQQTGLIKGFGPDSNLEQAENSGIIRPEEAGYDYWYSGIGDVTNAIKVRSYMVTYARDADGNLIPEVDGDGNPLFHEDGTPRYKLNFKLTGGNADGFDKSTSQFALKNVENGQYYYAYCIDSDTETTPGAWYKAANLEDCGYFPVEDSKNHIRAIVNNGYWGTESGTGSVSRIIAAMKAYYGDGEITASIDDKNNTVTLKVSDIIDGLTESEALAVTQAAIWTYANGSLAVQDGKEGRVVKDIVPVYQPRLDDARPSSRYYRKGTYGSDTVDQATKESNARIQAMYQWLLSLTEEASEDITTVINEKNFLVEDSMGITVGEKIMDADAGRGIENDVYNVDLTFAMVVEPSTENGDDLIVKLLNEDGTVIRQARLAGDAANDGEDFTVLVRNDDNSYTFKDIPMAENSDLTFDLKLEGTQYLKKGVYVYTSPNTDETNTFQTLVGIAEGAQHVGVSAALTFSFAVDDSSRYHAKTSWSWEEKLEPDPAPGPTPPPQTIPQTGDDGNMTVWLLLMVLSTCGIVTLTVFGRDRDSVR